MQHPDEYRPLVLPSVYVDASSLRMIAAVDALLTPDDWTDAAAVVPSALGPHTGRLFVRRPGEDPAVARWYSLTPAEALGATWPSVVVPMAARVSGKLSPGAGEYCERALAWCQERDLRLPAVGWTPGQPVVAVAAAQERAEAQVRAARERVAGAVDACHRVHYLMDEGAPSATSRPFDWRHALAFVGLCIGAVLLLLVLAEVATWV